MKTDELLSRLATVEHRMRLLQREVDSIRLALKATPAIASSPTPVEAVRPLPPSPVQAPKPAARLSAPAARAPEPARREFDLAEFFGAQALAWAGGVVTLLGVLFFFVLAVNRGWIGPGTRVGLAGAASASVLVAGLWLRRRFGETYASLAAVGAGIAGGYASLAAAAALYHLVSNSVALVTAAAIAAAAFAVALAWRAELVAALGLVGAIGAPALLAVDGGLTATGTGFAALMALAALAGGVWMRWPWLMVAGAAASAPQIAALIIAAHQGDGSAIALACVFGLLYLATGVAEQFARRDGILVPLPVTFVLGSIGLSWLAADQLFGPGGGLSAGLALLVAAAAFGAVTTAAWMRGQRELGTLLGTIALAAAAVGVADALNGATLAYTFAAESVVLSVAARRLREPRMLTGALGYLVLAGGHALAFDAPPSSLFDPARQPALGAGALASTAVAAFVIARLSRTEWRESSERGVLRFVGRIVTAVCRHVQRLRVSAYAVGVLLVANTISLLVLQLGEAAWPNGGVVASFHRGQVALTLLWSLAGLVGVIAATRGRAATARLLAFAWLGLTALKVAAYDGSQLVGLGFTVAFLGLAAALVLAGFLGEVLARRARPAQETFAAVLGAVAFAVASTASLDGETDRGLALLATALVLLTLAVPIFPRALFRDLATLLWAPAIALAAAAGGLLLSGSWLTLAWALGAAALAGLATATHEPRLQAGSFGYLVLTTVAAFGEAPPWHLVVARPHPAHGIVGLALLVAATVAFAWASRDDSRWSHWYPAALWSAAAIAVYAASLAILELSVHVSAASLHTDFQRGHSAVSALWGALGLAFLYVGLRRRRRALRLGGFALFAVSLCKLFLYDLSQLSSVTRALSFLAVGAVLLLAGFFTQQLSAKLADSDAPPACDGEPIPHE